MEQFPISIGKRRQGSRAASVALNVILILFVLIIVFELTFFSRFKRFYVVGQSMYPTLTGADYTYNSVGERIIEAGGDYVYADTAATPQRGDIVVITTSNSGSLATIIKRAIAFGGEKVELVDGALYIDGALIEEPYVSPENNQSERNTYPETLVPEGYVFVLGDNRDNSNDSRGDYGMIALSDIVGIVPEWSMNMRGFITPISTFFDFTLPSVFSGCN